MVEFFNSLEMRVQRSEFKGEEEVLFPAETKDRLTVGSTVHARNVHMKLRPITEKKATKAETLVDRAVDRLRLSGLTEKINRPIRSTVEGSDRLTGWPEDTTDSFLSWFQVRFWSEFGSFGFLNSWFLHLYKGGSASAIVSCNCLLNNIFRSFCPEDVGKLPNHIKLCVLTFFFVLFVLAFDDYSLMPLSSAREGFQQGKMRGLHSISFRVFSELLVRNSDTSL